MKTRLQKTSIAALVLSLLPLATFIPILAKLTLPAAVQTIWAAINIVCVVAAFILSVVCVKDKETRSAINVVSMIISVILCLNIAEIGAVALLANFLG